MNQNKKSKSSENKNCPICEEKQNFSFTYQNFHYYKCSNCGQFSTYPFPTESVIKKHYSSRFKKGNYLLLRKYAKQYSFVYNQFVEILKKRLKNENKTLKNKKILDIGCFTGGFLQLLKSEGSDIYGLELQQEAVEIANKTLNGRVFNANVTTYNFPQKKYDIISLLGLIEHVPHPMELLYRSNELLKKDGLIIIQTPNSSSFLATILGKFWPPFSPVEHIHLFSRKSLELALYKSGFTNLEFVPHWKKLPVGYVYNMFNNFGPEFHFILKPLDKILKDLNIPLPFYIGEMIIVASKK